MPNKLWTLLSIQFLNKSSLNRIRHEADSKKRNRSIAMMLVLVFVAVIMAGYCFAISYGFGYMGMSEVVPGYALTITAMVTLIFTFFKTNGYLFAFKDYDLLMALPVKPEIIITAKFLYMYLNNLIFAAVVMLPMAVGYGIWQKTDVVGWISWGVGILIAPLFPMTIAAAVGVLIAAAGAGFKHKVFVQSLLSVLLLVVIFGISFWIQGTASTDQQVLMEQMSNLGAMLSKEMHKIYPLSAWFDSAVNQGNLLFMVILPGFSLIWYGIFVVVVGKFYRQINTGLMTFHANSNYRMSSLKTSSMRMAIVKKEARRFFSSTNYLMNCGVGLIIAIMIAITSIFYGLDQILGSFEIPNVAGIKEGLVYAMPFAIAMLVNMTCTSSVSLSLEGKNLWVVQSLPIPSKILYQAKIIFNLILVIPVSLLCSLIFMIELKVTLLQAVLYVAIAVISCICSSVLGMWINIHFPKFDWENEVEVIKQGMASAIGIFGGMIGYMVLAAAAFAISFIIPGEVVLLVATIILSVSAWFVYQSCMRSTQKFSV